MATTVVPVCVDNPAAGDHAYVEPVPVTERFTGAPLGAQYTGVLAVAATVGGAWILTKIEEEYPAAPPHEVISQRYWVVTDSEVVTDGVEALGTLFQVNPPSVDACH